MDGYNLMSRDLIGIEVLFTNLHLVDILKIIYICNPEVQPYFEFICVIQRNNLTSKKLRMHLYVYKIDQQINC